MDQLLLGLKLPPPGGFDAFVADGNTETVAAIRQWSEGRGASYLLIHGASGAGKSHLLQAACRDVADRGRSVAYLPLGEDGLAPEVLDDLDTRDAVAIDGLERVAGDFCWERALFNLYNNLTAAGGRLLAAARAPAAALELGLADLGSRLGAGPAYALHPLDDAGRAKLLGRAADQRALRLDDLAIGYILSRCPRDPAFLLDLLDAIDRTTLQQHRPPTLPLIREVIASHGREAPASGQ